MPEINATTAHPEANEEAEIWTLRLYVAGHAPRSLRAVKNIHEICAERIDALLADLRSAADNEDLTAAAEAAVQLQDHLTTLMG